MNAFIKKLVVDQGLVLVTDLKTGNHEITDCIFRYGMKIHRKRKFPANHIAEYGERVPFVDETKLVEHSATQLDLDKVRSTLEASFVASPFLTEDLFDIEYLRNHYDVPFIELMSCLLFLSKVSKEITVLPWFGSSIMIRINKGLVGASS